MSTAQLVPETWELSGDDAAQVLREARVGTVLVDSVRRFRVADGFSHARSLTFASIITVIPALTALVGLASVMGSGAFRQGVIDVIGDVSPSYANDMLSAAIDQGGSTPRRHGFVPLAFGLVAMVIAGMTCFGQIERGANRIYGIEQDRPFRQKYGTALSMFLVCVLVASAGLVLIGVAHDRQLFGPAWLRVTIRFAAGSAVASMTVALVLRRSPRRHQPHVSWLLVGSSIATGLWLFATIALAGVWHLGDTFGETYGPLAGVMAFALWAYLISIGLFLGIAFAAQLEAVRAGRAAPQDAEKVPRQDRAVAVAQQA